MKTFFEMWMAMWGIKTEPKPVPIKAEVYRYTPMYELRGNPRPHRHSS